MAVSAKLIDLIDGPLDGGTAGEVGRRFFHALVPFGIRATYARSYSSLPAHHVASYSRISPAGWEKAYADENFDRVNFMTRALKRTMRPFVWSTVPLIDPGERRLADALHDFRVPDGIAVPCAGPNGEGGVFSLGFERMAGISPAERVAIEIAALTLHNRMSLLARTPSRTASVLTARERDCIAYIAEGKSDNDIAAHLGVSVSTVITHVQNARRKLGAKTRAQAVAVCLASGGLERPRPAPDRQAAAAPAADGYRSSPSSAVE